MNRETGTARQYLTLLALGVVVGLVATLSVPVGAASTSPVPPSGTIVDDMLVATSANGREMLITPRGQGVGFRIQYAKYTQPALGFAGQITVRYSSTAIAVELPGGKGWLFEVVGAEPKEPVVGAGSLKRVGVYGLAKFNFVAKSWGLATPILEACQCPESDSSCSTGDKKALTCSLTCFNQPGSVTCAKPGACCWCDNEGKGVCAKCCFSGDPELSPSPSATALTSDQHQRRP